MFQFPAFASYTLCIQMQIPYHNAWKPKSYKSTTWILQAFKVGSPIRKSMDQSLFAAPHSLSQRITSFFACACQGIHQMPLIHFFVLIVYAHLYLDLEFLILFAFARGVPNLAIRTNFHLPHQKARTRKYEPVKTSVTFYNQVVLDDIDVSIQSSYEGTPVHFEAVSLRPASRDIIR